MTVSVPRISTAIGITYALFVTDGPMISAIGIAVANTRTESASARVTMNTIDVNRRVARPKRCLEQRVRGDEIALEVARQQHVRDDEAADDVAGDDLQEAEVADPGALPYASPGMLMNVSALVSLATIENMTAHHGIARSATK